MGTGVDVYKRQVFMLKPADGMEGAVNAIVSAVQDAGPNAWDVYKRQGLDDFVNSRISLDKVFRVTEGRVQEEKTEGLV